MDVSQFEEDEHNLEHHNDNDFVLNIDGYEGPIDLLLDLARTQKVDLSHISILALVRQYLDFIEKAKSLEITIAADYLVMAAWLAYLKSRLLVPQIDGDEEQDGQEMVEILAFRLRQLEAIQNASKKLRALPRQYPRGMPQGIVTKVNTKWGADIGGLLAAYGCIVKRKQDSRYDPPELDLMNMDEAIARVKRLLHLKSWTPIMQLVPKIDEGRGVLYAKSALSAALAAGLELTKQGHAEIRQETLFAGVDLRARSTKGIFK